MLTKLAQCVDGDDFTPVDKQCGSSGLEFVDLAYPSQFLPQSFLAGSRP